MLWLPSKRGEEELKDMDGGQAPGGKWTSQDGGTISALTAPTAAQVFHRVQLAFRSSQLNTAGPLFGTKSLSGYFETCATLSNI